MTTENQPESATELLNQAVRLLGILVVRGMPEGSSQADKILLLNSAALPARAIVELTGAAPQTVANRVSEARSAKSAKSADKKE